MIVAIYGPANNSKIRWTKTAITPMISEASAGITKVFFFSCTYPILSRSAFAFNTQIAPEKIILLNTTA
ncbi:Uncharacterised protein [Dorea longicatena]|nr:Uncharacterised protein [Dorea longicatena]